MKAKIVLSVATMPDKVRDSVVAELLVLNMSANVTPIVSVICSNVAQAKVEHGVSVDILEYDHVTDILKLWKRLRDGLNVNCFWIETFEVSDDGYEIYLDYKGCVCEWPTYLANTEIVGPQIITGTK